MDLWNQISYQIVRGIYVIVAKIYDIMIGLVDSTNSYDFSEFTQSIYVIAGLFMLFRVVIGMIQMLINPDQVTDKSTGAGKLVARIVVVIVLLLAFAPAGFLMKPDGMLDRVEQAIIGPDGLLENFSPEANTTDNLNEATKDVIKNNNLLVENVYAEKLKTCYFAQLSSKTINNKAIVDSTSYKIVFYNHKCDGCQSAGKNSGLYVKPITESEEYNGKTYKFKNIKFNGANIDLKANTIKNCENWYIPVGTPKTIDQKTNPSFKNSLIYKNGKYFSGYNSLKDLAGAVEKDKKENPEAYENDLANGISGVDNEESVCFATNTISSFQECKNEDDEECKKAKLSQFGGYYCSDEVDATTATKSVDDLMGDKALDLSFMIAIIAGVLIIVFLVMLCVDVVIRNLKLMLLDMLAPIPIICYADPKDKIFMNWLKMYGSVYADLFIKLFAIKIALILIAGFDFDEIKGIEYFFVIIAILLFAKMVPSMISKIFGIELSGSMKDIGNMLKSGAGLAAGAAIGGAVGAGAMAGTIGSAWKNTDGSFGQKLKNAALAGGMGAGTALGSIARGAGSGSKGKIFEGAKGAATTAGSRMGKFREGFTPGNLVAAATVGRVGMDYASRADKGMVRDSDKLSELDKMAGIKGEMENIAEESKFMKTLRARNATGQTNYTESELEDFRDRWIESQISGTADSTLATDTSYSDKIIEAGKQAGIREKMSNAQILLSENSTVRDTMIAGHNEHRDSNGEVISIDSIDSFANIKDASTISKKHQTDIRVEQARIKESDAYRVAAAARSGGDKPKS